MTPTAARSRPTRFSGRAVHTAHRTVLCAAALAAAAAAGCKKATVGLPCNVPEVGEITDFCQLQCQERNLGRCRMFIALARERFHVMDTMTEQGCMDACLQLHPSHAICLNEGDCEECLKQEPRTQIWRGLECPEGLCIAVQEQTETALCTAECQSDADCRAEGTSCVDESGAPAPFVCVKPMETEHPLFPGRSNCDVKLCVCQPFADDSGLICQDTGLPRNPRGCDNEGCPAPAEQPAE